MHIYQLLPYVLSTAFSTHPKPLTWNKKPFQSRRVLLSTFFDTMRLSPSFDTVRLFNILIFFQNFFIASKGPINFLIFCNRMDVQKVPKRRSFYIFRHYATYRKLQKNFEKKSEFFSQFFVFWELLLSPVVEKVVFVFESFWALDMGYGANLGRSRLVSLLNSFHIWKFCID